LLIWSKSTGKFIKYKVGTDNDRPLDLAVSDHSIALLNFNSIVIRSLGTPNTVSDSLPLKDGVYRIALSSDGARFAVAYTPLPLSLSKKFISPKVVVYDTSKGKLHRIYVIESDVGNMNFCGSVLSIDCNDTIGRYIESRE